MSDHSDFNDEILKDKLEILLDEENEIKKWNEGLLIKSLIDLNSPLFSLSFIICETASKPTFFIAPSA